MSAPVGHVNRFSYLLTFLFIYTIRNTGKVFYVAVISAISGHDKRGISLCFSNKVINKTLEFLKKTDSACVGDVYVACD